MNVLLINPPNCGRSIPEEKYGITSLKQIFRGEPLALEELAGNLTDHTVRIVDLKANPDELESAISEFKPDIVGITGVTCEANTVVKLAVHIKAQSTAIIVVGGIHASIDPEFFNKTVIDYIIVGIGKKKFAELIRAIERGATPMGSIRGVLSPQAGKKLLGHIQPDTIADLEESAPPAYGKVRQYRSHYILEKLRLNMGFVASAFGCPYKCSFCCIYGQAGGKYLTKSVDAVVRDIQLLHDIPVIRLVDANTFDDIDRAYTLCRTLMQKGIKKQYLADIRSDTVVRHPEMLKEWKKTGLRAVIIGFEEVDNVRLRAMNKANQVTVNTEAISILNELGITIVGDFVISPDYDEDDFERLEGYLETTDIDLPMITVLTPLPGTPLYAQLKHRITNTNLDYYTLTNAVIDTKLKEERFYTLYARLIERSHIEARI
ncbi:B12-binding domain-containing radical SAM protein [Desulfogranum japonicum]|uniref:B12-binding domain-containing radical SAM protein n=1 Tax=Desulfogranum japonicum TaxID=231447 RepID=UPI0004265B2C|nr:B12-binding domain-containing radical SAM protein [Desulfogranum japonicum]